MTIAEAIHDLLVAMGEDPDREGLQDTPIRVARFYEEFIRQEVCEMKTFSSEGVNEMIVVGGIPFYSLCEHHLLPFFGTATIGYIPDGRIVGLSKLPRVVQMFARGLQNQERITQRTAEFVLRTLNPEGVGVVLRARHLCMEMRGLRIAGAETTTSALRGAFFDDERCRKEFLDLDRGR